MTDREKLIKSISNEFANWEVQISNLNSINLFDANIISEYTICKLLNEIFNYKLINLNSINRNQTAIDLGDNLNNIAFQITSTKSSKKIQSTITKFLDKNLETKYEELFILILGKKQKKYPIFATCDKFNFDSTKQILDFKDLLRHISFLPTAKITKINKILLEDNNSQKSKQNIKTKASRIKRNLALKKRIQRDFLIKLDQKHWERLVYEPYWKFKYHQVIIRSVENDTFPNDHEIPGEISNWFKINFWDFYDNGIEMISSRGGRAIFDKNGYWDILDLEEDKRGNNPDYKIFSFQDFLRIPYDFIVEYDMETDPYYGLPAIYVEYAKDGMPYDEIVEGRAGNYEQKLTTFYFDKIKRKKLK